MSIKAFFLGTTRLKKLIILLGALIFLTSNSMAQPLRGQAQDFKQIYNCARKLYRINSATDIDYYLEFIADDLFYILDRHSPALYLFTPYFAGMADLSIDKEEQPIVSFSNNITYNLRIPYFPDNSEERKGYYYMTVTDSVQMIYEQLYYQNGQRRVKRLDPPQIIGPHDARSFGLVRFCRVRRKAHQI